MFEVHVGELPPEEWKVREDWARYDSLHSRRPASVSRPPLASEAFPWLTLGIRPRFVGAETIDCVAAVQPNMFDGQGAREFVRYTMGAKERGETAIMLSMMGAAESEIRHPLATHDASINLPAMIGCIAGRRLGTGARAELAVDLDPVDKDLALRLRNRGEPTWWAMDLAPTIIERAGHRQGPVEAHPGGELVPILRNAIGETLAGVWVPESDNYRWYVVPWGDDWPTVIDWLVTRALPRHVPGALRRARTPELVDDELLTTGELSARDALSRFEERTMLERARLEVELARARTDADEIRFGLLYGSSRGLVLAVKSVLESVFDLVEDLDEVFGEGVSGDLLVSIGEKCWLVEVKGAGGNAGESLMADLERHLRTWPQLGRRQELAGGVLIVNHQHHREPLKRQPEPYARAEFVASLSAPVVPTLALFRWWRDGDRDAIARAITGEPAQFSEVLREPRA